MCLTLNRCLEKKVDVCCSALWLLSRLGLGNAMKNKKIWIASTILILAVLFFYFDLRKYLTLTSLKENHAALVAFYESHQAVMISGFIAAYIVQTALSLPGAAVLSLAAGAVFGAVMGTLYVNIGATIGASLAFLVARYLFRDVIQNKFETQLGKINTELETRGFNYLLFLRLVPSSPSSL